MARVFLIDGSGYIFRAYHALPPLKRPDGLPVGAVFGFCVMLSKTLLDATIDPACDRLAVVFDAGRKTFRQDIYPDYKAHRPPPPDDLIPQFSLIREACTAYNIPAIEESGFEADDLIATYACTARDAGYEVVIVSSDKDLMQLVAPGIGMLDPLKNKMIGEPEVLEKFGVKPDRVIDVQALAGDSSDNVPGVPGIGIKTAAELINTYGSLEDLLMRTAEIKQPKRRQSLEENIDKARIFYELVKLRKDAPLPYDLDDLSVRHPDEVVLRAFLRQQGFNTLLAKLDTEEKKQPRRSYETVTTLDLLKEWVKKAHQSRLLAIDTETTSLNSQEAHLVGISLATAEGDACYIPIAHQTDSSQLPLDAIRSTLDSVLTDPSVLKIGHNIKYDLNVLNRQRFEIRPIADTMLMSYVLDAGKNGHGMDELAEIHLQYQTIKYADVTGSGRSQITFDHVPIDKATAYAAEDADVTLKLYHLFRERLIAERMVTIYERIDRPLVSVLADMEQTGIKVDPTILQDLDVLFSSQMARLEAEIIQLAGREFNLASPKQLGEILFDELAIPGGKRTKTGAYVTDADVLESLANAGHALPAKILEWRGLAKLRSTYIEGLLKALNHTTGRIHTSYSLAGTTTGRISSSDPNLQNIPVRTENGRKIRSAFIAETGYALLSLDYSQIELRLLAHMADVPTLSEAFRQGQDIHSVTASNIFGVSLEHVDSIMRRKAKMINFGIIYGISAFGLSQQLSIPQAEAAHYIKAYFERYPGIQAYMESCKEFARHNGYVRTLFGRKCYTPTIQDKNPIARQFAERQAINAPLQGTNADIIKRAMIRIPAALSQKNLKARMLLQVHDELLFEVPHDEIDQTIPLLKVLMENVVSLKVPLIVDTTISHNWAA